MARRVRSHDKSDILDIGKLPVSGLLAQVFCGLGYLALSAATFLGILGWLPELFILLVYGTGICYSFGVLCASYATIRYPYLSQIAKRRNRKLSDVIGGRPRPIRIIGAMFALAGAGATVVGFFPDVWDSGVWTALAVMFSGAWLFGIGFFLAAKSELFDTVVVTFGGLTCYAGFIFGPLVVPVIALGYVHLRWLVWQEVRKLKAADAMQERFELVS